MDAPPSETKPPPRFMNVSDRRLRRALVALAGGLAIAVVSACGGSSAPSTGAAPSSASPTDHTVHIALSDTGCQPSVVQLGAGPVTFVVSNPRSSRVQSFGIIAVGQSNPLAQVTNVLGGLTRNLDADLAPGTYIMRCKQNGAGADGTITVAK